MRPALKLSLVFALLAAPAYAESVFPSALLINGKPIDPFCFESASTDEWLDVTKCVNPDIIKTEDIKPDASNVARVGYNYRYKDIDDGSGYTMYDYIGLWSGAPVILVSSNTGGTGKFTSLLAIEREGKKIRVLQGFAAGDRCNGGVVDVKLENGVLHYGQRIVPFDFLQLADDNPNDLQAYESLETSATSCFGVARYADTELTGVTLKGITGDEGKDRPEWTEKFVHQSCFNKIYSAYLTQGKKDLSVQQLKEFTGEFNRVCLDEQNTVHEDD